MSEPRRTPAHDLFPEEGFTLRRDTSVEITPRENLIQKLQSLDQENRSGSLESLVDHIAQLLGLEKGKIMQKITSYLNDKKVIWKNHSWEIIGVSSPPQEHTREQAEEVNSPTIVLKRETKNNPNDPYHLHIIYKTKKAPPKNIGISGGRLGDVVRRDENYRITPLS